MKKVKDGNSAIQRPFAAGDALRNLSHTHRRAHTQPSTWPQNGSLSDDELKALLLSDCPEITASRRLSARRELARRSR
jgi:hypothetical protein